MSFTPTTRIPSLWGWTDFTSALPSFYWDVESAEQRIKEICCKLHKLCEYANMLGENINIDHDLINELQTAFEKFMESGFDDYYKEQVQAWIDEHLNDVLRWITGHVFFGLTEDGYFCAYIPETWQFVFDTIVDYQSENYGRLVIKY